MEQYYSYYILRFISRLSNFNSPSSCIRLGWHYVVINSSSQMWPFMFKKLESSFMDPCHKASLLNTNFRSFRACLSNSAAFMSSQLATSVRNSRPLINRNVISGEKLLAKILCVLVSDKISYFLRLNNSED